MEIDLLRPSLQIKIFLSVFWLVFMLIVRGVEFTVLDKIFIVIVTILFVLGWFKYPYPFNILVENANAREKEYNNQESSNEDA